MPRVGITPYGQDSTSLPLLSPFQQHVERWRECGECGLCRQRQRVVFARGKIPCDLLCCGEAPGESEDVLGRPFVGPAGRLLDAIIERAVPATVRVAYCNLVGCIPRLPEGGKASEPVPEEIRACAPRLVEFVKIANPRLVVCVGALSRDYLDPKMMGSTKIPLTIPRVSITHPAAILRANLAMQSLAIQRCVVTIATAVREYLEK